MKIRANNRTLATSICIFIILTILLAMSFSIFHGEHECSGENCLVCQHLKDLANLSKDLGNGIAVLYVSLLLIKIMVGKSLVFFDYYFSRNSLISLKVRMNN